MDTAKAITHISLCAGYGGIDIGLKRCLPTLRTILVSEIEAYAVANLVAKMQAGQMDPAPIWTELKTLPWDCVPKGVSILSGGFPCQPFSAAGKRETDSDPRHLFPYIKNAIRIIRPGLVFLENVEGIISAKLKGDGWGDPAGTPVLLHVLRELERVGYHATAGVFSAAEVGATHQRKRVFILAHRIGAGLEGHAGDEQDQTRQKGFGADRSTGESSLPPQWPARPGAPPQEWEEPRVVSQLGGAVDGSTSGLDPTANRVDRLRLLGNGVVPDTCEIAFRTLFNELTNK